MSTWSSRQVQCGGIGHGSFRVRQETVFEFGKHRGKHINQVDNDYLERMVATVDALTKRGKMKRQQSATRNVHVHDLLSDLKSCTRKKDLQMGKRVHAKALETGIESNMYVAATLINMYAKCGSMVDARTVFDGIQEPDVVSWNALILGYAHSGQGLVALDLLSKMKDDCRCVPTSVTYLAAVKACTSLAANGDETGKKACLERGREIHLEIGCHMDHFLQVTLIGMYAKCGSMEDARTVFDNIQEPDIVSWNALILGYADNGQGLVGLDLFYRMKDERRCAPNSLTYLAALKACTSLAADGDQTGCLKRGREIHSGIGCRMNHFVQVTLINMYAKCGAMEDARAVFDSIEDPDVVSWTAVIQGYAESGQGLVALDLFSRMKDERRCAPDSVTYVAALKACMLLASDGDETKKKGYLDRGREIHSEIGCHMDHFLQVTLIRMYAKCGSMADARTVFDGIQEPNVVPWNALILGYADNGQGLVALDLFSSMKDERRSAPNSVTYLAALKACTSLAADGDEAGRKGCLERGREVHLEIGCHMDQFVQNALVDMYAKCGSMQEARAVFDSIQEPDVVSWNALILGYADDGQGLVALDCFSRMKEDCRCTPNCVTYVAALKACGSNGALAIGRRFHSEMREFDAHVVTSLVDFYAKCGSMEEAREVFDLHPRARDVSTWNALLAGYGRFGNTGSVFSFFEAMQDQDFQPNAVTLLCILGCCSHAGLVEKAWEYLEVMPTLYGLTPTVMHYTCMVDLLGRANKLDVAVTLLQKMPCDPDAVTWMALLGACHKWENVEIGRMAFKSLVDLDQKKASAYILMAEIYGSKGMWEEQERVLETRMKTGAWKLPGQAYVMDAWGRMVGFVVGKEDPVDVENKLKQFFRGVQEHGYVAKLYNMTHSIMDDDKEKALCGHCERRAVVYGILNTPPEEVIRVVKNMRMCNNCHWSTKKFSKLLGRVIMVRDESQFHVMENDNCSCGDYW